MKPESASSGLWHFQRGVRGGNGDDRDVLEERLLPNHLQQTVAGLLMGKIQIQQDDLRVKTVEFVQDDFWEAPLFIVEDAAVPLRQHAHDGAIPQVIFDIEHPYSL